jgi:hypothetical protein
MKPCTLFVDLFGPCIQDGVEVKGAFNALADLTDLLGPENIYILGGLQEVAPLTHETLEHLDFFKKTCLDPKNVLMFEQGLGIDAKFLAISRLDRNNKRPVCVIDDSIEILGRFPRRFLRVLLGYDQEEYVSFEESVLKKLSADDIKQWDTLLIMPTWQVHFPILKRWVRHPETILTR